MAHEILVLQNGDQFTVWDIVYSDWSRQTETHPCVDYSDEGKGKTRKMESTVDLAEVRFRTHPGNLPVDQSGQLSHGEDEFDGVTILAVEEDGEELRVTVRARRRVSWRILD